VFILFNKNQFEKLIIFIILLQTNTQSMLEFAAVFTTGGILLFSTAIQIDHTILISLVNRIIDSKNL